MYKIPPAANTRPINPVIVPVEPERLAASLTLVTIKIPIIDTTPATTESIIPAPFSFLYNIFRSPPILSSQTVPKNNLDYNYK